MPGGFLGVDVFFVLSGYLITSLLRLELSETSTIQLRAFWGRRLRRLVPALLAVLVAVLAYAFLAADTSELDRLATDGLATLFYVANWHFIALDASYFDQFNAPSPLLHTWSLAIEEQWYLVWPLIMIASARWLSGHATRGAIIFCTAALASAVWMAALFDPAVDPSRVYYGTDTRAQDLLVGSALAFWMGTPRSEPRPVPNWLGLLCGLLVIAAFCTASDRASFTYRGGLLCFALATAGVIASAVQPAGLLRRALSTTPIRYIGRISYGMYLWHWPMLLFLGPQRLGLEDTALQLACIASTGLVASLSYHLLESPIRAGALQGRRIQLLAVTSVATIAVCFVAISPSALSLGPSTVENVDAQLLRSERKTVHAMVVGDSIAASLASGYSDDILGDQLSVVDESLEGCSVARGRLAYLNLRVPMRKACATWPRAWKKATNKHAPDIVVFVGGAWEVVDREVGEILYRTGTPQYANYISESFELGLNAMKRSKPHVVLLTTPCFQQRRDMSRGPVQLPAPRKERNEPARVQWFNKVLRNLAAAHPETTSLIDLHGFACPGGDFPEPIDGLDLQPDGVHFSEEGAAVVWRWLAPQLAEIAERKRRD